MKGTWSEGFFFKTLILAFEVIVQPPKHTFEIGFFPHFELIMIAANTRAAKTKINVL